MIEEDWIVLLDDPVEQRWFRLMTLIAKDGRVPILDAGFAARGEPHRGERANRMFALDFAATQGRRSGKVRIPRSAGTRGSGRRHDGVSTYSEVP